VVATLKTIEVKVAQILATFGGGERVVPVEMTAKPVEVELLNGPQHPSVAMGQSDIDKLLASFE
jgi:chemotaxis protein CheZ